MSDEDRFDRYLERDWGEAWESLPEAPPLMSAQPKNAQLTLRVPAEMVTALREVARRKALPYHALARSWIADGLREQRTPSGHEEVTDLAVRSNAQLNVKLTASLLDELKRFSHEVRVPYHRLARLWIERGLRRELTPAAAGQFSRRPSLRELMILLLDAPSPRIDDFTVLGITRLQKLLFVIEKQLAPDPSRFYAHHYGPFDEQVNDAADALQVKGFLQGKARMKSTPPSADDMMASVLRHAGPRDQPETYALTTEGRVAAEQLRRSSEAYVHLAERIGQLRQQWDQPDLIERIYEAFPEYTSRSVIRDKVSRRTNIPRDSSST